MQKLIIDTDPGNDIDDLLAILFALRRPELDIKAITTVTVPTDRRARMAKRLLRYLNRTDIPVAAGMNLPLRSLTPAEIATQYEFPRTLNHYAFAEPEDPADAPASCSAVDLIIRTIEQHPNQIALACIAPLTNIACVLRQRPDLAPKIQAIYLMGGETNLNRAEYNIAWDSTASDIALTSGIPIFMGTWDITRRFVLTKEDWQRFHKHPSPLYQALGRAIDLWQPAQSWKPTPVMYDLFPMLHSFDQSYYITKPMSVQVVTSGLSRGMTIPHRGEHNIHVTTDINADKIHELYVQTVFS